MKIPFTANLMARVWMAVSVKVDRIFGLAPWEVKPQDREAEARFRHHFQSAAYNQVLLGLQIGFVFAVLLFANYASLHGLLNPTFYFRLLILSTIGVGLLVMMVYEDFSLKNFEVMVSGVSLVIILLLCSVAVTIPHSEAQLLASTPSILFVYFVLFGFTRLRLRFSIPVALCAIPPTIFVLELHGQPLETIMSSAVSLLVFVVGGGFLARSIERRERALFIAAELAQSANSLKSKSLGQVAHDLRNPLLAVELSLGNLAASAERRGDQVTHTQLRAVLAVLDEARELVNVVLDDTRLQRVPENYQLARLSIRGLIEGVVREVKPILSSLHIDCTVLGQPLAIVLTNEIETKTILRNLLANAIKFRNDDLTSKKIVIRTKVTTNHVCVFVHDNGVGISKRNLGKVWQPGFTTESNRKHALEGKGLGLAMVKEICDFLPGHRIIMKSKETFGTSFYLRLPFPNDGFVAKSGLEPSSEVLNIIIAGNPQSFGLLNSDDQTLLRNHHMEFESPEKLSELILKSDVPVDLVLQVSSCHPMDWLSLRRSLLETQGYLPIITRTSKLGRHSVIDVVGQSAYACYQLGIADVLSLASEQRTVNHNRLLFKVEQ